MKKVNGKDVTMEAYKKESNDLNVNYEKITQLIEENKNFRSLEYEYTDESKIINLNNDEIENLKNEHMQKLYNIEQKTILIKKDNQDLQNQVNNQIKTIESLSLSVKNLNKENNELHEIHKELSNINDNLKKQIDELIELKKNYSIHYTEEIKCHDAEILEENDKMRYALREITQNYNRLLARLELQDPMAQIHQEYSIHFKDDNSPKEYANNSYISIQHLNESFYDIKNLSRSCIILTNENNLQYSYIHSNKNIILAIDKNNTPTMEEVNNTPTMKKVNTSIMEEDNNTLTMEEVNNTPIMEEVNTPTMEEVNNTPIMEEVNTPTMEEVNNTPIMEEVNIIGIENYNRYNGASEDQREDIEHSKSNNILIPTIILIAMLSIICGCFYMFDYHKSDIIEINDKTDSADTVISTL